MQFKWNLSINGVLASSVAALLLASTSVHAIPKGPCDPKPQDLCCEEAKPGPFAFAYPTEMALSCPRDFYFWADGLAFQAKEDGLDFAISDTNGSGSGAISQGEIEGFSNNSSDWDYNPGFRVGAGFIVEHDAWNLDFQWTWLNITDYKHANVTTSGGAMIPLWLTGAGTPLHELSLRSSAVWDTSYNTLDINLGKAYHVTRHFTMQPHFGVRAGWIDQHFSVDYNGDIGTSRVISHNDNDFWGIGTRAGFTSDWILGKGWCLFGNAAFAMLFGKFEIGQSMTYPTDISTDGFDLDHHFYQNVPNFEMALGLGWSRYFDKNKYHIALKAAYEFHEWFDQLQLRKFSSGSTGIVGGAAASTGAYASDVISRGNLTLNGFSLRLKLDI